jgi:hypothetical protein
MRVVVLIKADENSEAGKMPDQAILEGMGKFNEALVNAGVMLAGEGLHPSSKGKRVKLAGGKTSVIDGPFAEAKELIAGFWIWKVASMDEAVAWIKRLNEFMPSPMPGAEEAVIELRPVFETEEFGDELTPELRAQEQRLRQKIESQQRH